MPTSLPAYANLVDALRHHAAARPERTLYRFVSAIDADDEPTLSYAELDRAARRIASALRRDAAQGDVALLLYPPGLAFIEAFMGCLYAGVIAVPVYLPNKRSESWARLTAIATDAGARLLLTDGTHADAVARWLDDGAPRGMSASDTTTLHGDEAFVPALIQADDIAFLQYTSGSTGDPKGVMVSHGNLIANQALIQASFGNDASDVVAGWLPQYHDMGLIGNILQPLYLGAAAILMQPLTFLRDPGRWLDVISRYGATISGGPDFAYRLCAQRIDASRREGLDLSRWRVAFNGAEPVSPATMEMFTRIFAAHGFRAGSFYPCYGLAEGTLLVTGSIPGQGPVTLDVRRQALEAHRAEPCSGADAVSLAGAGRSDWSRVRIVDPSTLMPREEGLVGEIWTSGPSITNGYWKREALNQELFRARLHDDTSWLRTGDLGFVLNGELFVTGRLKDLIIVRGRNYYPQDIEASVQQAVPAFRDGCGAAFAIAGSEGEALVVIQELERSALHQASCDWLFTEASAHIANRYGLRLHALVLVKPAVVPKTSSGKLRRSACRASWLAGELPGIVATFQNDTGSVGQAADDDLDTPLDAIAHVLGRPAGTLRPDAPLTAQGLDSLRAAELEHVFARRFDGQLDMSELLAGMTLAEAMSRVGSGKAPGIATDTADTPPALPVGGQRLAIWRAQMMYPASPAYTISTVIDVESALDEVVFADAVHRLLAHHPLLSTTYQESGGEVRIAVRDDTVPLNCVNARGWSAQALQNWLRHESSRRIDLANGPVFAINLVRRADEAYTLQWLVHHIVVDSRSMQHLVKSLFEDYRDLMLGVAGEPAPAPSYERYEAAREIWLDGPQGRQAQARYAQRVGDLPAILSLPADRQRPPRFDFSGAEHSMVLPASEMDRLAGLAADAGATTFHVLFAAWAMVLHRLSGQDAFIVGVPVADRPPGIYDNAIGCFVDLKQVPCEVHADDDVSTVVRRMRQVMLDVLSSRSVPAHRALGERAARTDWASSVAPNIRFALLQSQSEVSVDAFLVNCAGKPIELAGFSLRPRAVPAAVAAADLALTVALIDGALHARFVYATSVFSASRIEAVAAMYRQALVSMPRMPACTAANLPLLDASERARQLALSAAIPMPPPEHACVHLRIEAMAARHPQATALVHEDLVMDYAQLDQAANRLANELIRRGIGVEDRVALYLRRSAEMVIAFLATLKAGACSVMLEPSLPLDRCHYILEDSSTRLILTNLDDIAPLDPGGIPVLDVRTCIAVGNASHPGVASDDARAAYVLYTSGSTGRPKGVIGLHRAIANRTEWMIRHFGTTTDDRILHATPLGFVRAEREILYPLCAGATLVIQPDDGLNRPERILHSLERHGITSTASSPSLLRMILDHDASRFGGLHRLRRWFIGADILRADLVEELQSVAPGLALCYFYGSTEVASDVAYFDIPSPYASAPQLPAGRPLPNTRLYILDAHGEPCPPGIPGELHVGGMQLARGYVDDDALTQSRFVPDPFLRGERMYRTGDLAWRNEDDLLVINGRADDQLSIDGHRVEPGEIEHAIRPLPGVRDVVVMPSPRNPARPTLVAYVAGADAPRARSLRTELQARLPTYMIPALVVPMASLPVTSLGKIDRAALRTLDLDIYAPTGGEAPGTSLESAMVDIFAELCGIPTSTIDVTGNFAEFGASSVLLGQFVRRLNALSLPRPATITDVYEHPCIRTLAAALKDDDSRDVVLTAAATTRADARRAALSRRGKHPAQAVPMDTI